MKTPKKHRAYWKVKAAFLEVQQATANAKAAHEAAEAKFNETMKAVGLDPAVHRYRLDDATETIAIIPPDAQKK